MTLTRKVFATAGAGALALWYNFIRIHKTLRVPPAMQAGVVDHLMSYEDLVAIVDDWEANQPESP